MCVSRCQFLFNNYTNIFNRLKKDELDMNILGKLLFVLKQIEDGHLDQHSGSYEVGKILKEMYIDSAIKQGEKYDTDTQETKVGEVLLKIYHGTSLNTYSKEIKGKPLVIY